MNRFSMGNLADWQEVGFGELVEFPEQGSGVFTAEFEVMSDRPVGVRAVLADRSVLVGAGFGLIACRFAIDRAFAIVVEGEGDGSAYVRTGRVAQVMAPPEGTSYTTPRPREAGPSDELRRMMLMVQLNARRREDMLRQELDRLRAGSAPAAVADNPVVEPAAEPKAE